MAETTFENFQGALETVEGTPEAAPTHFLNLSDAIMNPQAEYDERTIMDGTLADSNDIVKVRETTAMPLSGPLDIDRLTFWLNMLLGPATITTPGGGTTTRLHTHERAMTSDPSLSATFWWGDPAVQVFQSAGARLNSLEISGAGDATEAATLSLDVIGKTMDDVADPADATRSAGPRAYFIDSQLWLDTTSAIGTTAITGRLVSGAIRANQARTQKYLAKGAGSDRSYTRMGIGKSHAEMDLVFEFDDLVQHALYTGESHVKARLRLNGPLLEGTLYNYVEMDIYGKVRGITWGTNATTNRTLNLTIRSLNNAYAVTAGHDYAIKVQKGSEDV